MVDIAAVKAGQRAAWAAGDFAVIGATLQIVGESLCEAVDFRAGSTVLDVACGSGNAALAAARRWCAVTGLDYVPEVLRRARERALAERFDVAFVEGDAEQMPFDDHSFDVVLSTFGVMFTPDQERAARELVRVAKKGGKIGLASWTPQGFVGQLLSTAGKHVRPPPGIASPVYWGSKDRLGELFRGVKRLETTPKAFVFRYTSADHFIEVFRRSHGPIHAIFGALDAAGQQRLANDIVELAARFNRGGAAFAVPGEYLEVVIEK